MPLIDSNNAALWDGGSQSLYRAQPYGTPLGYVRDAAWCYLGDDPEKLITALEWSGLLKTHRLVLLGAGFGWVAERFVAKGYGPLADGTANGKLLSVDTSTYIQANKTSNAAVQVLDADVNAATGRRTIRQQFGSNNATVDWVVTEDVLPILSDAECGVLASSLRGLATNVAHWVSTVTASSDPRLNWKTLQQWKTLMTPDLVIQRGTATVL